MIDVDIAVIGSGSGNSLVTDELSDRRFAIIEGGDVFGGTCLNVGCIPTKMYVHVAEVATMAREGGRLGVDATLERVRFTDVRDRVFAGRIEPLPVRPTAARVSSPSCCAGRRASPVRAPCASTCVRAGPRRSGRSRSSSPPGRTR